MTTRIFTTAILSLCFQTLLFAQAAPKSNVHIGLVYPLSTNGVHAAEYSNTFSLHAISGLSRNERSFCASGVASIVKDSVTGFIASGFATIVGKEVKGGQFAGFINYTRNHIQGFAAAGFVNVAGSVEGAAAAGFANIVSDTVHGLQIAGFINEAKSATVQAAGFINIAHDVQGAQIAGFINIAKKVKGTQIAGFINIADSSDCPIGLINLIKNGEKAIGVTVDQTGTTLATFRSGGHFMYGIVGVGFNPGYNTGVYAMQGGIGAHLPVSKAFRFSIEASVTSTTDFSGDADLRSGIRFLPAIRVGTLELFAGPSFNFTTSHDNSGLGKTGYSLWNNTYRRNSYDLSLGIEAGVQFHLESTQRQHKIVLQGE